MAMKRICALFIATIFFGAALLPMTDIENTSELERSLSLSANGSQSNIENLSIDLTSWHLSEGDYIQYSNYGDDYFQLLNNSGHSPKMTSSFFQINVLEDQPCNFGGYETICYVISQTTLGNLTWYDGDGHPGGHDGHDDHDGDHDDHGGDHDEDGHDGHDNHGDNSGHDNQDESMDYTEKIVDQMEWNQITHIYPDFSAIHVDIRAKWD